MTPPPEIDPSPWTNEELVLLHEMVRDYDRAKWLRGQMKWWGIWILGAPTIIVSLWQAVDWAMHKVGVR